MGKKASFSVITNLQIVFWVSFVFLSTYSFSQTAPLSSSIARASILVCLNAVLFYSCYLYLVPHYFEKKKYVEFYILLALLIAAITSLRLILKNNIFDFMQGSRITISSRLQIIIIIISELIIALISSLMKVAKDRYEYERKYQETQNQFLESELNYLKSQISPHFLLNSLNNIYSFAVTNSPQTPQAVLKLSEILKYFLYESNNKQITINREIEIIQAYIDLFSLRFEEPLNISLAICLENSNREIEPLLLMSLVENAFKHSGIGMLEHSFIHIKAESKQDQLIFAVSNSITQANETIGQYGGIGLQNISKRLLLNYPGRHEFNVTRQSTSFSVKLIIPFL